MGPTPVPPPFSSTGSLGLRSWFTPLVLGRSTQGPRLPVNPRTNNPDVGNRCLRETLFVYLTGSLFEPGSNTTKTHTFFSHKGFTDDTRSETRPRPRTHATPAPVLPTLSGHCKGDHQRCLGPQWGATSISPRWVEVAQSRTPAGDDEDLSHWDPTVPRRLGTKRTDHSTSISTEYPNKTPNLLDHRHTLSRDGGRPSLTRQE